MTGPGDQADTSVTVSLGDNALGSFPVTTTRQSALPGFDEVGTATVVVTLPATANAGTNSLVVTGNNTGTQVRVPVVVVVNSPPSLSTTVTGSSGPTVFGSAGKVSVSVTPSAATGTAELYDGTKRLGSVTLVNGAGDIAIPALALEVGSHQLTLKYLGASGFDPSTATVAVTVTKAASGVAASAQPTRAVVKKTANTINVDVSATGFTPTGTIEVRLGDELLGTGPLSDGSTSITLDTWDKVDTYELTVAYLGDTHAEPSSDVVTVKVVKQTPSMKVRAPKSVKKNAKAVVTVVLDGVNANVTGRVKFTYQGNTVVKNVVGGKVQITTEKLKRTANVKVDYLGDARFDDSFDSVKIIVKK